MSFCFIRYGGATGGFVLVGGGGGGGGAEAKLIFIFKDNLCLCS